jgi:hypothetical protein
LKTVSLFVELADSNVSSDESPPKRESPSWLAQTGIFMTNCLMVPIYYSYGTQVVRLGVREERATMVCAVTILILVSVAWRVSWRAGAVMQCVAIVPWFALLAYDLPDATRPLPCDLFGSFEALVITLAVLLPGLLMGFAVTVQRRRRSYFSPGCSSDACPKRPSA